MNKDIFNTLSDAGDSITNVESAFAAYVTSIIIARNKWEKVVKDLDEIINKPQINIGEFEIDG